jgi:hypothetical protein
MRRGGDTAASAWEWALAHALRTFAVLLTLLIASHAPAGAALKPTDVSTNADRIDISALGEYYEPQGDQITIETAPGADGMTARLKGDASTPGTNPAWFAFALRNSSDKQVERWLAVDRYNMAGSGVVWPDLAIAPMCSASRWSRARPSRT